MVCIFTKLLLIYINISIFFFFLDIISKKQVISDLYNQHKEEQIKYNSYIKELPSDLLQIQNKINEFIEEILYQLLNEILYTEKKHLCDEKINRAIETYLKSCINKISTILQGNYIK